MSPALAFALALVRAWTRLYTARMEPMMRDARRAEIESDLWELHEDARRHGSTPAMIGAHMVARLTLGMAHDLFWRAEHTRVRYRIFQDALWATAVASIAFVWWLASSLQALDPPPNLKTGGIDVMRLLYPLRAVSDVRSTPPTPVMFVRLTAARRALRPPPLPPPPKPASR
jgi:hypothetical protein